MAGKSKVVPLPRSMEEIRASRASALPSGVWMVSSAGQVLGLHLAPGGIGVLEHPDFPWRVLPAVTSAKRRVLRSRVSLRFADGSRMQVRPFVAGQRGLVEAGQPDGLQGSGTSGTGEYGEAVAVVLTVLILPGLYFLVREMLGLSPRARAAAAFTTAVRAAIA